MFAKCYYNYMGNNTYFRKTSTVKLVCLSIISCGIYWYVWLWKLITDINKLFPQKGKCIHRYNWLCALIGLQIISLTMSFKGIQTEFIINIAGVVWFFINLLLTLQILKNIERYVKEEFDLEIKHNPVGWIVFGSFYINYKINRLNLTIQKGIEKRITEIKTSSL